MSDPVTKLAYQTMQQGKSLLGLAHKEVSTRLMDLVAPQASASTCLLYTSPSPRD